jgi:hypothetical protein
MSMLNRLFPRQFDNAYHGSRLALWLLGLLLAMKAAMSLNSIFNGRLVASSADGIPLDSFTPAGAQTVVAMFAIWAVAQLVICLLGVLALVRYRSMVPMILALILLEHASRKLVLLFIPVARTGSPPAGMVNLVLFTVEVVGLALALRSPKDRPARE